MLELMVVLATIALVTALILPALAQAKGKASKIDCISRLKNWSVAFTTYADDHEGMIPRECYEPLGEVTINNWSQVRGISLPGGGSDSQDVWYNALPPVLDEPQVITYAALSQRRKFFDTRRLIHCPSAKFPSHAYIPTHQFPLFSLAMNSQLIQSGPTINVSLLEGGDASRIVTFLDNLLEGETMVNTNQASIHLGQPGAYANRFSPRHGQGGNLAFADGHVSWFRGPQVVETDPGSSLVGGPILPPKDIIWEVYP